MNPADIKSIVNRFVAAFNDNDCSDLPLAPDIVHAGPMLPEPIRGAKAMREHVEEVAPFVRRLTLKRILVENDSAAAVFEYEGINGVVIEGAEFFRLRDGVIVEDLVYFDTRPLLMGPR